jgi:hypothetical protein
MRELAAEIRAEVEGASAYLQSLGEAEVSSCRTPGKWSKKEILGHLIDSAANNHQRFVRAQFANPFVWPGYEQEPWVSVHRYRERSWAELVSVWRAFNVQVAAVVEGVAAETLQAACSIGRSEAVSLEWLMQDYPGFPC